MSHPWLVNIDWDAMATKNIVPPFKPNLFSELDVSNFDPEFTNALNAPGSLNARAAALASGLHVGSTPLSPSMQAKFQGFTFVDENHIEHFFSNTRAEWTGESESDVLRERRDDEEYWEKP
jgi:protein-serine/threonine kinase